MAVPKSVVTDTELNVLKVLWGDAPLSAREITHQLYQEVNPSSMGTVQKLITRLEEKNMIVRDDGQMPHRFRSSVGRDEIAGMQLDEFARKLSGGSLSPFVMHLVQTQNLSKGDREEIRRLLEED